MMLELKLQYFGHLMRRVDSLEKTLMLGGIGGRRRRGRQRMRCLDGMRHHRLNGHEFEWTPGDGDGQGGLACYDSWGHKESDMTEWLNWTEKINPLFNMDNGNVESSMPFFCIFVSVGLFLTNIFERWDFVIQWSTVLQFCLTKICLLYSIQKI